MAEVGMMAPHPLDEVFADPAKAKEKLQALVDKACQAGIAAEGTGPEGDKPGPGAGQNGSNAFAKSMGLAIPNR